MHNIALLANQADQISRMLAADKGTLGTTFPQPRRQRQAAHDMTDADVEGSIGAEVDFYVFFDYLFSIRNQVMSSCGKFVSRR